MHLWWAATFWLSDTSSCPHSLSRLVLQKAHLGRRAAAPLLCPDIAQGFFFLSSPRAREPNLKKQITPHTWKSEQQDNYVLNGRRSLLKQIGSDALIHAGVCIFKSSSYSQLTFESDWMQSGCVMCSLCSDSWVMQIKSEWWTWILTASLAVQLWSRTYENLHECP